MYLSDETLREIQELQKTIIEGSITHYSVDFLELVNDELEELSKRVLEEYKSHGDSEECQKAQRFQESRILIFKTHMNEMIEILESDDNNEEKVNKTIDIVNKLRKVIAGDMEPQEDSDFDSSLMASRNFVLNEYLFCVDFSPRTSKFSGIPDLFDSWYLEILELKNDELRLNNLQFYSLARSATSGLGRKIFVYLSTFLMIKDVQALLDKMKDIIHDSKRYYQLILKFFKNIGTTSEIPLPQSEIYKKFHDLLRDIVRILPDLQSSGVIDEEKKKKLRSIVLSNIEDNLRANVEENFSHILNIYNFLKCIINVPEIVYRRKRIFNPDGSENVLDRDLNEPMENLRFEAPFVIFDVMMHEKLSNSVYRASPLNQRNVNFMVIFNQKAKVSYIHRSLVQEGVNNVIVYLFVNMRLCCFIAFVTDDYMMDKSLMISCSAMENMFYSFL